LCANLFYEKFQKSEKNCGKSGENSFTPVKNTGFTKPIDTKLAGCSSVLRTKFLYRISQKSTRKDRKYMYKSLGDLKGRVTLSESCLWKLSRARKLHVKNCDIEFYENPTNDLFADTGSDTKGQADECPGRSVCYVIKPISCCYHVPVLPVSYCIFMGLVKYYATCTNLLTLRRPRRGPDMLKAIGRHPDTA
jgi:hypothetical protein